MSRLLRLFEYFKRSHSAYFSFVIQILNFTNILFVVLITLDIFKPTLQHYFFLILLLIFGYFPLSCVIGRWDYKHGSFIALSKILRERSPIYQELFERLERLEKKGD